MKILPLTFFFASGLLATGCFQIVVIPEQKVGLVYNVKTQVVTDELLKPGTHSIGSFSEVVAFNTLERQNMLSFDVVFKDATSAYVRFSLNYILKTENLPKIYQDLGAGALEHPFDTLVTLEARSQVRDLLMDVDKNNITKEIILDKIRNSLRSKKPIADMIEINSFSQGEIIMQQRVAHGN
jgi:hypothetical protein